MALQHAHAVTIYDFGFLDQTPFMVMELLNGQAQAEVEGRDTTADP